MIIKKILSLIAILVSALLFSYPSIIFGIGQMTEPIIIENARQGEVFEETLYLLNTEKTETVFKITAENDIADWVKFYDPENPKTRIEKITIPQNSRYEIIAKFSIPKGTPNGEYLGTISIATYSENEKSEEKVSTTVSQKIDREVRITVVDQEEINLKTSIIPEKYSLKKGEPLKIRFIYDNQSNIKIRPQIQLKLEKNGKTEYNAIYPFSEELKSVNSFSMKEIIPLEIQTTGLEDGKYLAKISIIVNEENKYEYHFSFTLGDINAGAEKSKSNIDKLFGALSSVGGSDPVKGWFIIGGIFLIIAQVLIIINRRKKREKV